MVSEREVDHAFEALFPTVLAAFPNEALLPTVPYEIDTQIFYPETFDELRDATLDLQRYRLTLPRNPFIIEGYADMNKVSNSTIDTLGLSLFEIITRRVLIEQPVVLLNNQFPYEFDGVHKILWYRPDATQIEKATLLTETFLEHGVGEKDFVILTNPSFGKSVSGTPHAHVLLRKKDSYGTFGMHIYDR